MAKCGNDACASQAEDGKKYCSKRCKQAVADRVYRAKKNGTIKTCLFCGGDNVTKRPKYCSDICRIRAAQAAWLGRQEARASR